MARPRKVQPNTEEVKETAVVEETPVVEEPNTEEVKPLTKIKNIRGGDVALFGEIIPKDGVHEFDESKLSEIDLKRLKNSYECKLIEKV